LGNIALPIRASVAENIGPIPGGAVVRAGSATIDIGTKNNGAAGAGTAATVGETGHALCDAALTTGAVVVKNIGPIVRAAREAAQTAARDTARSVRLATIGSNPIAVLQSARALIDAAHTLSRAGVGLNTGPIVRRAISRNRAAPS